MPLDPGFDRRENEAYLDALVCTGEVLGRDIVEVAAFLDDLESAAEAQLSHIKAAHEAASSVAAANDRVQGAVDQVAGAVDETMEAVSGSAELLRDTGRRSQSLAAWVQSVDSRMADVVGTLSSVHDSNAEIVSISKQVNILAINAKIEAVRAGDAGRGFAVVAEAINQLSHQTATAADKISRAISGLRETIVTLKTEAGKASGDAGAVLSAATETDQMLGRMTGSVEMTRAAALDIAGRAQEVRAANDSFAPYFHELVGTTRRTAEGVKEARARVDGLVTMGETVVQNSVLAGASHADATLIDFVRQTAAQIGQIFEAAVDSGKIGAGALFDQRYAPIPNTDPQQVMAPYTALTDALLPSVQEPALDLDPRIVFCAAVDRNGYLPTHNRKYSRPQGDDPVWNTANCRNRRIFGDRVGLRAGRSQDPFLIQIYRRDMGGGDFVLMKDLSAPIAVKGRHWGGLRLAYRF
ncbi:methyl-accepting chemotaxis protein [Rhodovulum euryhalinum]|nr:methyl-accepting chemotaxis protein [Rhodovulum euryhalinum]